MNTESNAIKEHIMVLRKERSLNQKDFGALIGVSKAAVSSFEKGSSKPSIDNLVKLADEFQVSLDWMVGLTEIKEVGKVERQDFALRSDKREENQNVPLYNITAAAGLVSLFNSPTNIIDYIKIPNLPKCDGAIHVAGDSMYPLLKNGDIVAYKQVAGREGVLFGEMYVVDVAFDESDVRTLVKYLHKGDTSKDHLYLVSENRHHEKHEIHWSQVKAIGLVKAGIRINSIS